MTVFPAVKLLPWCQMQSATGTGSGNRQAFGWLPNIHPVPSAKSTRATRTACIMERKEHLCGVGPADDDDMGCVRGPRELGDMPGSSSQASPVLDGLVALHDVWAHTIENYGAAFQEMVMVQLDDCNPLS